MDINMVLEENERLKQRITELEDKLKNYSNPSAHKAFYEKNKEKIIKESSERLKKLTESNPEKIKEYRRTAYLKRKEKLKNENIKEN
jgi:cell division septum initiation protein DivIVA